MKKLLLLSTAALMIVAGPAAVTDSWDAAQAKNEKSNGKDKSDRAGGNGKSASTAGKAGGADKQAAKAARAEERRLRKIAREEAKAARTEARVAAKAEKDEAKVAAKIDGEKNLRAQLGALNAAHASPQALANASPESRVGRIALYKEQAEEAFDALEDVNIAAEPLLDAGLTDDDLDRYASYEDYDSFVDGVEQDIKDAEDRIAEIEDEDGFDPENPGDEWNDLTDAIEADNDLLDVADDNKDELEDYAGARDTYDTEALEARDALTDAANKEITDENYEIISTEVNRLLGIGPEDDDAS